jgi:flagellar motor switch protein FliN/FliY
LINGKVREMADENTDMTVADELEDQARYGITVNISAILGVAEMTVEQVLRLGRGAVIELERGHGETIELIADGQLVARGEVVVVEDMLAVQVTEIISKTI